MKRLLAAALVISTLCLPTLAQKKGADDFNDLIKRYYAAWSTLNPDNASFLYAKDADLVFFDIAPLKYSGGVERDPGAFLTAEAAEVFAEERGGIESVGYQPESL